MKTIDRTIKVVPPGGGKSFWVVGELYTFKAVGEDTDGEYFLFEMMVPPQSSGPPAHLHHQESEAFYMLEGELFIETEETSFTATPGSFVLIPKGVFHTYRNLGTTPAKVLAISAPAMIDKFFEKIGVPATDKSTPPPPPTPAEMEQAIAIAQTHNLEFKLPQM